MPVALSGAQVLGMWVTVCGLRCHGGTPLTLVTWWCVGCGGCAGASSASACSLCGPGSYSNTSGAAQAGEGRGSRDGEGLGDETTGRDLFGVARPHTCLGCRNGVTLLGAGLGCSLSVSGEAREAGQWGGA